MRITTTKISNSNGTGQIRAKGFGKQRTVTFDHSKSPARNHGEAAGTLLLSVPENPFSTEILAKGFDAVVHNSSEDGSVHTFEI